MTILSEATTGFQRLEQISQGNSLVHKLNPLTKTVITFLYVIAVVSFDRYSVSNLIPFVFYPVLFISLGEIPVKPLLNRLLVALPFCLFAGGANLIFDREILFMIGEFQISSGFVSLISILLKATLTVTAVLILIATTPMPVLSRQLIRLKVPSVFVLLMNMIYRYISVALEETWNMYTAYSLRAPHVKGIRMRDMGSFVGQLLLRSFDRGERVYLAMKCRGYSGKYTYVPTPKPPAGQWFLMFFFALTLLFFRWMNVTYLVGSMF